VAGTANGQQPATNSEERAMAAMPLTMRARTTASTARLLAAAAMVLFGGAAHAQPQSHNWNQMIVFGDSLSDTGSSLNYTQAVAAALDPTGQAPIARPVNPFYGRGRWTNGTGTDYQALNLTAPNQNTIWHWELADRLGLPRAQSIYSTFPGVSLTNYACGGAVTTGGRVTTTVNPVTGATLPTIDNVGYQLNTLFGVTTASMSARTLYVAWAGGNDIRNGLTDGTITTATTAQAVGVAAASTMASHIAVMANRAVAQGVRISVVWPNVVPMNLIPDFADAYGGNALQRGLAQNASINFRNQWLTQVAALRAAFPNNLDLIPIDFHNFFIDINNGALFPTNPAIFNRTDPILNFNGFSDALFLPTRNSLTNVPAGWNPDNSIFWDRVHPTARIHALMGEFTWARVPSPGAAVVLALGGLVAARRRRAPDA
jgi:phospholipase/lecithinase/hemolysin